MAGLSVTKQKEEKKPTCTAGAAIGKWIFCLIIILTVNDGPILMFPSLNVRVVCLGPTWLATSTWAIKYKNYKLINQERQIIEHFNQ